MQTYQVYDLGLERVIHIVTIPNKPKVWSILVVNNHKYRVKYPDEANLQLGVVSMDEDWFLNQKALSHDDIYTDGQKEIIYAANPLT